jgi:hypothetical protein
MCRLCAVERDANDGSTWEELIIVTWGAGCRELFAGDPASDQPGNRQSHPIHPLSCLASASRRESNCLHLR